VRLIGCWNLADVRAAGLADSSSRAREMSGIAVYLKDECKVHFC